MTEQPKHTPKDWVLDAQDEINRTIEVRTEAGSLVAVVYSNSSTYAPLIAAAPDLLEALRASLVAFDKDCLAPAEEAAYVLIEQAIAKAEGRPTGTAPTEGQS